MPRIPDYDTVGTTVPRTSTPRFADRSSAIEAEGRAGLVGTVGGLIQAAEEHDDKLRYAKARSMLFQADVTARQALQEDNNYEKYEAKYTDALTKVRQQAGSAIRGGRSRQIFEAEAQADFDRNLLQVRQLARGREVETGIASLSEILEANRNAALEAPDQEARGRIFQTNQDAIQGAIERGYIRPEKGVELGRAFVEDFSTAYIGMQSPAERVKLLNDRAGYGRYIAPDKRAKMLQEATRDAASAQDDAIVSANAATILETYERNGAEAGQRALSALSASGLPVLLRDEIRRKVNTAVNGLREQRRQENADLLADIEFSIASESAGRETMQAVNRLYQRGALTAEERATRFGSIQRSVAKRIDDERELAAGAEAIRNATPLDPANTKTRGAIDKVFRAGTQALERGSPEYQNLAVNIAERTNIAPTDAINWARTVIVAGSNAQQSATAANFLYRLEQANPAAYRFVEDPKLKAYVGQVNDAINAGTPSDAAVKLAFKNTFELTEAQQKAYREQYSASFEKSERPATANATALKALLDGDDSFDQALFSGAPPAPIGLQAEFNSGVERYYAFTGGDLKQARQLAWRDVRSKWGYSTVNGEPELLPYAPERMFPQIPVGLIQKDLAESASKIGFGIDKPRLVQIPGETAGTGGLIWNVGYVDEFGSIEIARDSDNRPYRYQLPTGEQLAQFTKEANAAADAKIRGDVAKQREMRKLLKERADAGDEDAFNMLMAYPNPAPGVKTPAGDQ